MIIRQATVTDLPDLRKLYDIAKRTMNRIGNQNQWKPGEPFNNEILETIEKKQQFVVLENDEIIGTFVYFQGPEPIYEIIKDGSWPNNDAYGTIHRVASNGKAKGVLLEIFDWATKHSPNIRMDTHKDNTIMNHLLVKHGFIRCGLIYLKNGNERIAYAKIPTEK